MGRDALIRVAVGSQNPVKIEAADKVMRRYWPNAVVSGVDVTSGVRDQPLTDDEAILGAKNRARRARTVLDAGFGVGIEGNTIETAYGMFGTGWAVIVDVSGRVGIGAGGRFLLPDHVAEGVRQGEELGLLMDRITGEKNTKQRHGAVGILTAGAVTRRQALELAVQFALTSFIQPTLYAAS